MKVYHYPSPVLKNKAESITNVNSEVLDILDQMKSILQKENGLGLAAPQVGISKRLVVIDSELIHRCIKSSDPDSAQNDDCEPPIIPVYKMINPEITWYSDERAITQEGCLSLPGIYCEVERHLSVSVTFLNEHNEKQDLTADGLLAVCIQHELDHLNGILLIDHLSDLKRRLVLEKYEKKTEQPQVA